MPPDARRGSAADRPSRLDSTTDPHQTGMAKGTPPGTEQVELGLLKLGAASSAVAASVFTDVLDFSDPGLRVSLVKLLDTAERHLRVGLALEEMGR